MIDFYIWFINFYDVHINLFTLLLGVYRNNYARHCKSPPKPAGLAFDEVTKIDLCVILLEKPGQVII